MKFEKRSGDEAETPSSAPEETPSTGKKPVVIYIMILFIVAFLLMALSFLMHQRSNSEVIGELQDSVTAMQEVQATQDALLGDPRVKGFKTTRVVDVEVTDGKLSAAILENAQTGERTALPVDGIFVFLGQSPNNEWFKDAITLDDKGYILAGEDMSTNIPGVFGAGDIKHKRFRQITTAVSDGTTAALAAEAYLRTKNSQ